MILDPRALWTREDLAEYLKVSRRQVDNLRNELPAPVMIGKRPRWLAEEVMRWVAFRREEASLDRRPWAGSRQANG